MRDCCKGVSIHVISWNLCGISWENLELLVATCEFGDWDVLCIQEGLKNCQESVSILPGGAMVVTGGSEARGSCLIVLSQRMAKYFRGHSVGETCTGVFLDLTPPIRCVSWHAPTGAHDCEQYEKSIHEVERVLDELSLMGEKSVTVIGADVNCQLSPGEDSIGMHAAGERFNEHERAELIYGFLARRILRAASTYNRSGPTRFGLGARGEKEAPSQIDFLFVSAGVAADSFPGWIEGALETDHVPICQQICFVPNNASKRRHMFKWQIADPKKKDRIPLQWRPRNEEKFQALVTNQHARTVPQEMERIRIIAAGEQKQEGDGTVDYLQIPWRGLRRHSDTVTRRAYHHLIRSEQKKRKRQRESDELDRLLTKQGGGFGSLARRPARLQLPTRLEGDRDRKNWGSHIGKFYRNLYESMGPEDEESKHRLWVIIRKLAAQERRKGRPLVCHGEEIREIIKGISYGRAGGPDGLPSNVVKLFPWEMCKWLAGKFTKYLEKPDDEEERRPREWNASFVSLLAKTPQAEVLAQFRPISLSAFVQKIWEKWLANHIKMAVEARMSPQQHGFRSGYQSPELVQMLLRIKEIAGEWNGSFVFLKVDIKRAFDRVSHTALLKSLLHLETDKRAIEGIAGEILFAKVRPTLNAIEADAEVKLRRGVRQGSPLSGLLFIMILSDVLRPLERKWAKNEWGCFCGSLWYSYLLFADDPVLIGKDSVEIKAMLGDLQDALRLVGLETNEAKFQYIYGPMEEWMRKGAKILPGTDQSEKGMIVLGRLLRGGSVPDDIEDLRMKKAKGWGRYHAYKKILKHHTSRRHKLHLVESCILQAVLWMANTWKPTQQICRELRGFHLAVLRAVFPRPPGQRPEDCHPNTYHSRWIITMLQEEKRHLADVIFLQRFHRWAGHLARTPHAPLRQIIEYRDGDWWHRQHLPPWGIRHEGDRGNFHRWDQSLTDLHGVGWKDQARDRTQWKKLEVDLILLFQKPQKRARQEEKTQMQTKTEKRTCQVTHEESTDGRKENADSRRKGMKRAQVTQLVSTLQERYKRKYTRHGGILKEYLVPLGTSSECASGCGGRKLAKNFEAELARRKVSSTWARALSAVRPEQPLIDLVIQPLAGENQGGYDVFGTSCGLGRGRRTAGNCGRTKSSRCAGRPRCSGPGSLNGGEGGRRYTRARGAQASAAKQAGGDQAVERYTGPDPGRLHPTTSPKLVTGARLRRRDSEPGARGRRGQRRGGEEAIGDWRPAERRGQGRRASAEEEEEPTKRRRRITEKAMEKLEGGATKNSSIPPKSCSHSGGTAGGSESSASVSGTRPAVAPGLTGTRLCSSTLGAPTQELGVAREAQCQPASPQTQGRG